MGNILRNVTAVITIATTILGVIYAVYEYKYNLDFKVKQLSEKNIELEKQVVHLQQETEQRKGFSVTKDSPVIPWTGIWKGKWNDTWNVILYVMPLNDTAAYVLYLHEQYQDQGLFVADVQNAKIDGDRMIIGGNIFMYKPSNGISKIEASFGNKSRRGDFFKY